jgi:excisionase family DNA binding protein
VKAPPSDLLATSPVEVAGPIKIYSVADVAALLGCSAKTVEEWARAGDLPGLKPGGSWIFPTQALCTRLNELALEQARERKKPGKPLAVAQPLMAPAKRSPKLRLRPKLIDPYGPGDP